MKVFATLIATLTTIISSSAYPIEPVISTPHISSIIGQKSIISMKKDSKGVFWIGTESGLYRYDGANMIKFSAERRDSQHIPVSGISKITEASDGTLLVATIGAGLLKWDQHSGSFSPFNSSVRRDESDLYLRDVLVSDAGLIWLLSTKSVFLHNPVSDNEIRLQRILRQSPLLENPLSISENSNGDILITTKSSIVIINPVDAELRLLKETSDQVRPGRYSTSIHLGLNDQIYVGTDKGSVFAFDPISYDKISEIHLPADSPTRVSQITSINELLLAATDSGIFLIDPELSRATNVSRNGQGLGHVDVLSMERDGNAIWIGTYSGLQLLTMSGFKVFNASTSDIERDVTAFTEDKNHRLWIGTYNGLFLYNEISGQHRIIERDDAFRPINRRISSLESVEGQLWAASYSGGLQILDVSNGFLANPPIFEDSFFTKIYYDADQNQVWLSTFGNGVALLDVNAPDTSEPTWYLAGKRVMNVLVTKNGDTVASSNNKVYLRQQNYPTFSLLAELPLPGKDISIEITAMKESTDGGLWLGTRGFGMYKITNISTGEEPRVVSVSTSDSPYLTVYSIEVDASNSLWVSTNGGIVKLNEYGVVLAKYGVSDGLQGDDFELGASFKNSKGELFFGGPYGYNRFHPDDIEIDQTVPQVRLTDVDFPDQARTAIRDYRDTEEIILTHKDRSVTFRFSILDYTNPAQNQFRYMLEGFDDAWTEVGAASFAKYTNLPAGEYQFKVQAANPAGIWNTDGLSVSVRKSPPPWLSWWAFMIYGLSFLVLWWTSNRVYQSYTFRRKTEQLQHEKIALEIRSHDELQEQMEIQTLLVRSAYQHSRSTLSVLDTALKQVSESHTGQPESRARKWLHVLGTLERFLYYFADNPTANLHEFTNEIISELLENSRVPPETLVTINDVTEKYIPTANASPLALILYELLENAVQHAFLPASHANYLHVRLRQKEDSDPTGYVWELEVMDDGVGFEFNPDTMGPGLMVVHALVGALGGSLEVENVSGSKIRVAIPDQSDGGELDNLALSA